MFDQLWDEDPVINEFIAKREARGRIKGKAELIATLIGMRYPNVVEEAQEKLQHVATAEVLDQLAMLAVNAPDEETVRWLLNNIAA